MKNNLLKFLIIIFVFFHNALQADNLKISASEVKINKKNSEIQFIGNVKAIDLNKNTLIAEEANYIKTKDF